MTDIDFNFETIILQSQYIKSDTVSVDDLSVNKTIIANDTIFLYDDNATIRIGKFTEWVYDGYYEFHCKVYGFFNTKTKQGHFYTSWFYPNFNISASKWIVMSYLKVQKYEFKCYDFYNKSYPNTDSVADIESEITYDGDSTKPLLTGYVYINQGINVSSNTVLSSSTFNGTLSPCTYLLKLSSDDNEPMPCYLINNINGNHPSFTAEKFLIKILDLDMILI